HRTPGHVPTRRCSDLWKYQEGKATKVMAEIVQRNSDGVLVRGDLNEGDPIITEGILQLSEGANVTLLDVGAFAELQNAFGDDRIDRKSTRLNSSHVKI